MDGIRRPAVCAATGSHPSTADSSVANNLINDHPAKIADRTIMQPSRKARWPKRWPTMVLHESPRGSIPKGTASMADNEAQAYEGEGRWETGVPKMLSR